MTRAAHTPFEQEITRLCDMLGGRREHARFLFDDLADEAAHVAASHGVPFCQALRAAVMAFQIDFTTSRDAAVAHAAACARLEVIGLFSRGLSPGRRD